ARRDPDVDLLERILAAGPVRLYTLAPELPAALELVDLLVARGVVVSAGHSDANADEANAAFDRGVGTVTHLFNAMRPFNHRDPGVAGVALARPDVTVQIILDGVHLAPDTVRLVWLAAGGRLALVTDAVAAAGISGDGSYRLGDVSVEVRNGVVRRDGDGVLAGSVLTMIEAVRNLHALGVPLEAALGAATTVPARVIGADVGRIEVGGPADVVVLSEELEVERVLVGGEARGAAYARIVDRMSPVLDAAPLAWLPGAQYLAEIREQPAALRRLLEHRAEFTRVAEAATKHGSGIVRMVGHGSSDNAASFGVYAFGLLPGLTAARDSISLLVYYGAKIDLGGSVFVALSQSGRTPDVLEYVARARRGGAFTIAVTNEPDSELAHEAEAVLPPEAGAELAVAARKTYPN